MVIVKEGRERMNQAVGPLGEGGRIHRHHIDIHDAFIGAQSDFHSVEVQILGERLHIHGDAGSGFKIVHDAAHAVKHGMLRHENRDLAAGELHPVNIAVCLYPRHDTDDQHQDQYKRFLKHFPLLRLIEQYH